MNQISNKYKNLKKKHNWKDVQLSSSFYSSFSMLNNRILLTEPYGKIDEKGMISFLEAREKFLREHKIFEKQHVEIKEYSRLEGRTPKKARDLFVQFLLAEQERGKLKGFFGFNAPFWMRNAFNLALMLYHPKIPVQLFGNFENAYQLAEKVLKKKSNHRDFLNTSSLQLSNKKKFNQYLTDPNNEVYKDIEKMFNHINSVNWHDAGLPEQPVEWEEEHPFWPLYQAINMLKIDFDETLKEKEEAQNELLEINKNMESIITERTHSLAEKSTILETSLNILSHDTKNLFFNISYLIDQELTGPQKTLFRESFNELYQSVMEATGYIKNKKRIFSVVELVTSIKVTKDRIPLEHHSRIKLVYEGKPEDYYIETSSIFKNALVNLIENALKYTPETSSVIISIERDKEILIQVSDNGPGIPDKDKEKLFDKGYRRDEDKQKEGSGRGLWITRNLVRKENGELELMDNPEGGTIFQIKIPAFKLDHFDKGLQDLSSWFHIPLDQLQKRAENLETLLQLNNVATDDRHTYIFVSILNQLRKENREKTSKSIEFKLGRLKQKNPQGKKVLIIDDSLYVHYYLATYFTELGFNIAGFEFNGEDGLNSYFREKPDIVTMDNTMPVKTGVEAALDIYQKDPNVKILFITALGDSREIKQQITIPKTNYRILTKPFNKEKLADKIKHFFPGE